MKFPNNALISVLCFATAVSLFLFMPGSGSVFAIPQDTTDVFSDGFMFLPMGDNSSGLNTKSPIYWELDEQIDEMMSFPHAQNRFVVSFRGDATRSDASRLFGEYSVQIDEYYEVRENTFCSHLSIPEQENERVVLAAFLCSGLFDSVELEYNYSEAIFDQAEATVHVQK